MSRVCHTERERKVFWARKFNYSQWKLMIKRYTHINESSRRARASGAECRANVKSSIDFLHILKLQGALGGDVYASVSVIRKHELMRSFLRPEHRWLRISHSWAFQLYNTIDPCFHILRSFHKFGQRWWAWNWWGLIKILIQQHDWDGK